MDFNSNSVPNSWYSLQKHKWYLHMLLEITFFFVVQIQIPIKKFKPSSKWLYYKSVRKFIRCANIINSELSIKKVYFYKENTIDIIFCVYKYLDFNLKLTFLWEQRYFNVRGYFRGDFLNENVNNLVSNDNYCYYTT